MKILQIEAHPDYDNMQRISNLLAKEGYNELVNVGIKTEDFRKINLYSPTHMDLRLTKDTLLGTESTELSSYRDELIENFIDADQVYIYMPLHNFNIVSNLKDYFDTILIANKTFKYTENGSVGLLSNNKIVTLVMTSGSEYDLDYRYKNLDIAPTAVSSIFHMMGIQNVKIIRAQGLDILTNNKQNIIKNTTVELKAWIQQVNNQDWK